MTVILKLLCSLTLLPFIFACYRALQWGFWESAAYGFLGIVAFCAVWVFCGSLRCPASSFDAAMLIRPDDGEQQQ